MSIDPVTLAILGAGIYATSKAGKEKKPPVVTAPPIIQEDATKKKTKTKKYREPAQIFKDEDEDLRLGVPGSLGRKF